MATMKTVTTLEKDTFVKVPPRFTTFWALSQGQVSSEEAIPRPTIRVNMSVSVGFEDTAMSFVDDYKDMVGGAVR